LNLDASESEDPSQIIQNLLLDVIEVGFIEISEVSLENVLQVLVDYILVVLDLRLAVECIVTSVSVASFVLLVVDAVVPFPYQFGPIDAVVA
jgi:hypothetical protein